MIKDTAGALDDVLRVVFADLAKSDVDIRFCERELHLIAVQCFGSVELDVKVGQDIREAVGLDDSKGNPRKYRRGEISRNRSRGRSGRLLYRR